MLEFTFKDREDMENKIKSGEVQEEVYRYLEDLIFDNTYYSDMCNNTLSEDTVCNYFDVYFGEVYIDDINNSTNEMAQLLHDIIICVYRRFNDEINSVLRKNEFVKNLMNLGLYK